MKIKSLTLKNFMLFENARFDWSDNINVICGENSTGKTTLMKAMYSLVKPLSCESSRMTTKKGNERVFVEKLQGVFRPDKGKIGRLVSRTRGSNRAELDLLRGDEQRIQMGFGKRQENHADVQLNINDEVEKFDVIYISSREMISIIRYFSSVYEHYHIDFDEVDYDLGKLLERPLTRLPRTPEQDAVLQSLEEIMKGKVIWKNRKFYLKIRGRGEIEMGLVSDGYKKLSMITYLILTGSLRQNTVLFWDNPETDMNPRMIRPLVHSLVSLAQMGVQVFVSTHDYFVFQEFNMLTVYPGLNPKNLDIRFLSLYYGEDSGQLMSEMTDTATDLDHNAIMDEFDALYDREQDYIYNQ